MKLFQPAGSPLAVPLPWLFQAPNKCKNWAFNCRLHKGEDDPFFQFAMDRASLRFHETLRPDPLFTDPYIRCLLPSDIQMDVNQVLHKHCLETKFIDGKLLSIMHEIDELRQVVLLTDGMDTRPYRLNWPASTMLFDISPDIIFRRSIQKLEDVGAKVPRRCLFFHVPAETSDIQHVLRSKGFNGTRPSLWVFQGFPIMTIANLEEILALVSSLAMKGCSFFGELPRWLFETEIGMKSTGMSLIDKLFMSHGLRVEIIDYDEVARNLGKESSRNLGKESSDGHKSIIFMAKQLQFSDDQMEMWRREFHRIEEEGDEEGFEEL